MLFFEIDERLYSKTCLETLTVFFVLLLNTILLVLEVRVHCLWQKERCRSKLMKFIDSEKSDWTHESYPCQPISTLRSQVTVRGLRDGHQVNIPQTLLVCGDIISINLCRPAPANVRLVRPQPQIEVFNLPDEIMAGDLAGCIIENGKSQDHVHDVAAWYKVTQAPFLAQLFQLNLSVIHFSPLHYQKKCILKVLVFILIPSIFTIAILVNVFRWGFYEVYFTRGKLFLQWPVLIILPLVSLCFQILWFLSNVYGVAKIDWYMKEEKKDNFGAMIVNILKAIFMPYNFLKFDTFHQFGNVTAVCAVDKEYVLSGGFPCPDKVFFFQSVSANDKANTSTDDKNLNNIEVIPEILDITPSFDKPSGLNFDDPNWQLFMNSLKPIGLNVTMTSHSSQMSFLSHMSTNMHIFSRNTQCCCSLAHEIGVSKRACGKLKYRNSLLFLGSDIDEGNGVLPKVKSRYLLQKVQNDVPPFMLSIVCHEHSYNTNVVLSKGTADCITRFCSDFWDGHDLQPMKEAEVTAILDFFTRKNLSAYCIALSYNPYCDESLTSENLILPIHDLTQSKTQTLQALCNQTFVGMVSLQYYPKPDVVSLVQDLRNCGIRFIHFSAENEVRGKLFVEKLGLEAGWNCHISLSSCSNDGYKFEDESISNTSSLSSVFNATQSYIKAKLPKGVNNVRSHLQNVDNVPLLVPLFTDCSPDAVKEMMKIMQENGEKVLCLGNSIVLENLSIFDQADVGISLLPALDDRRECDCLMLPVVMELNDTASPMYVASMLNSLTCDILVNRERKISLHSIIVQARHVLMSLQKSLLFALGSSLSVSFLLFLSTLLFLPLPLSSSHEYFILLCVIPFLSFSMLLSKVDPKTSKEMPDRTLSLGTTKIYVYLVYFSVTYLPASCMCILLFWLSLNGICNSQDHFDCHFIFGNTNDTTNQSDLGWEGLNIDGHTLAQDCTMLFTTLYILTSSIMFIHHNQPIWKLYKFVNWVYLLTLLSLIFLQVLFFVVSLLFNRVGDTWNIADVPWYVWFIALLWPFVQLLLQELVKSHIRKSYIRSQRRLRLEFQTKLGMNSPF